MQEEVKWNDRMNIGVESIDKAHKRLFSIMRKLQISMSGDEDGRKRVCIEGIKYFKAMPSSILRRKRNICSPLIMMAMRFTGGCTRI